MENYLKFNLNDKIKVKIKEKGYEHLAMLEFEFLKNTNIKPRTKQDFISMSDSEGYSQMKAWEFIDQFGKLGTSLSDYIDINILIEQK